MWEQALARREGGKLEPGRFFSLLNRSRKTQGEMEIRIEKQAGAGGVSCKSDTKARAFQRSGRGGMPASGAGVHVQADNPNLPALC